MIGIDKAHNLVVVWGVLVAYATVLDYLECVKRDLYRFYPLALNGSRQNERVFFEIVLI